MLMIRNTVPKTNAQPNPTPNHSHNCIKLNID